MLRRAHLRVSKAKLISIFEHALGLSANAISIDANVACLYVPAEEGSRPLGKQIQTVQYGSAMPSPSPAPHIRQLTHPDEAQGVDSVERLCQCLLSTPFQRRDHAHRCPLHQWCTLVEARG